MNSKLHNKIIKINSNFYSSIAPDFSSSRLYPWKGWNTAFSKIKFTKNKTVKVLDLGCGNARFLAFLYKNIQNHTFDYLGIDNCDYLLKTAKSKVQNLNSKFKKADIFNITNLPKNKFSLVVVFGVTHHIPELKFRKKWFKALVPLVEKGGYLIISFWSPNPAKLLTQSIVGLENGDYLMGWGKTNVKRFVHIFSDKELTDIIKIFTNANFKLIAQFNADIKQNSHNTYLIFKR